MNCNSGYEAFKKFVLEKTEGFDFGDATNEAFLSNLVNYFSYGETSLNRRKGLLIRGSIGVGKTSTLRLIQKWLPQDEKFMYNPANDIVSLFNASGDDALTVYKKKKQRLFDDIGAEDIGKYYGNSVEIFEKIIYQRYDIFRDEQIRTHLTTNLNNEQLKAKYGERAYDRLKEMINTVNWNGAESKRGKQEWFFKPEKEEDPNREPTPEERAERKKSFIQNQLIKPFKGIKETGAFEIDKHNAYILFKVFRKARMINVTPLEDSEYTKKAEEELKQEAQKDKKGHKPMLKLLEGLRDGDKATEARVNERACVLYVIDYVLRLASNNRDIEQIAKQL